MSDEQQTTQTTSGDIAVAVLRDLIFALRHDGHITPTFASVLLEALDGEDEG